MSFVLVAFRTIPYRAQELYANQCAVLLGCVVYFVAGVDMGISIFSGETASIGIPYDPALPGAWWSCNV